MALEKEVYSNLSMDFVLWVSRVMHILSVVVWMGGLIAMNAVVEPVLRYREAMPSPTSLAIRQRFFPFLWSSLWTAFGTGLFLTVLSPRFSLTGIFTVWSQLLAAKVFLFLLLWFVSWQAAKVVGRIEQALRENPQASETWTHTLTVLTRRSVVLGILSLLCAAGMTVS